MFSDVESSNATASQLLVESARAGDRQAMTRLLMEHKDFIAIIVGKFVKDREQAQDLLQNIFVKIITKLDEFSNSCKFSTWVYRVAMNECMDYLRRRGTELRRVPIFVEPDEIIRPDARDSFADVEDSRLRTEIAHVLKKLPLSTQAAFKLFYYGGYSGKECAEILKTSEPNFFMKLKSGRDRVKMHLAQKGWV